MSAVRGNDKADQSWRERNVLLPRLPTLIEIMFLKQLNLVNFRNYSKARFSFSNETTLIVGPNASGKTNILEAIYYLAVGKSFRAEKEKEAIKQEEQVGRIKGIVGDTELEIILTDGESAAKWRKKFLINGVARRQADFLGKFYAVLFAPRSLELITGSPSLRREFFDLAIQPLDKEYNRALSSYVHGLRRRNKLLEAIRDEGADRNQLIFWDELLIKNGNVITAKRCEFVDFLNSRDVDDGGRQIVYDSSEISRERLNRYQGEEVAAGMTLVGPQRDDFGIETQGGNIRLYGSRGEPRISRDVRIYGSRGEQRMAVFWLKIGEMEYVESRTGEKPMLLLDDIFSELDHEHRRKLLEIIPEQQTIITTTDLHFIEKSLLGEMKIIEVGEDG
ncbi:MAG: DNA replication and repair protein RecF [bacterium]|nr:DNA replication and repair protein RecF [bacterium]